MREVHLFSRSFALNALERTSSHTPPRMTGDRERVRCVRDIFSFFIYFYDFVV